ncbi:MAG: guanylate kinase [Euzebyales bacterium]|nr:guanylate kinase [Euzebyales bacterium]
MTAPRPGPSRPSGSLFVVSGPGGVGKGTVVATLARRRPDLEVSVSATTRSPRPGEVDGVHYHFLREECFDALVAAGGFLEWATFGGRRYGTPWSSVRTPLASGRPVLLEIDVQGALQVRRRFVGAVLIFLRPPSQEALLERLRLRGTDPEERIAERMRIARWELDQAGAFDHLVVNDDLDEAVAAIGRILDGTR